MILIQKRKSEQKVSFTHQKFIGSLTQMTPFTYTWTPLGHVVGMLLQRQSPLIWEPYLKQDQALHKLANNNGQLKSTLGKCPIQSKQAPLTHMRIIMTYMLTLTKAGSKEETDEIKIVQHLKKSPKNVLKQLYSALSMHARRTYCFLRQPYLAEAFTQRGPYLFIHLSPISQTLMTSCMIRHS